MGNHMTKKPLLQRLQESGQQGLKFNTSSAEWVNALKEIQQLHKYGHSISLKPVINGKHSGERGKHIVAIWEHGIL